MAEIEVPLEQQVRLHSYVVATAPAGSQADSPSPPSLPFLEEARGSSTMALAAAQTQARILYQQAGQVTFTA